MSAVAQLAGVGVRRGNRWILDNVDLDVVDGQRWVLVGPNGAGKTTLLQVLGAQLHPTVGLVEILDEILGAVDVFELRPRIGMASSALAHRIPESEHIGNIVVSAAWAVVGRWREAYDDQDLARAGVLLEQMGLVGMVDRTWGTLSEGERKRVEIARALMTDPELLLLDEPAAGLDLAGREQLVEVLSAIFSDPDAPASVLVTHHLEEIPAGVTHALVMKGGRIVAAGPVETTLTSEVLSGAFDMPLTVNHADGRWNARAAH
ncbi:ABC transporter ATP-binding protein [Cutibacterium porci]|nr:ABC transporter ATP-binding protein [Cutibacterium porci]